MTKVITYRDRSYPNGELEIEPRGEFIRIEYSHDGYHVDDIYVPRHKLVKALGVTDDV